MFELLYNVDILIKVLREVYSNGRSEIILGKAIRKFNLPREEIVVMTKVLLRSLSTFCPLIAYSIGSFHC